MTAIDPAPRFSPELRTTVFYFTMFMSAGAANAFAGIWFSGRGLSSGEIGIVNAMPILLMLLTNLFVGRIADRASDWRQVIVVGALASGIFPLGLFFVDGFWGVLVFWTLGAIALQSVVPVADAAAMRITRRRGTDFGAIRAWGTFGYLLVVFAIGYLVVGFGPEVFLPVFVGLSLLRGLASLCLPKFRAPRDEHAPPPLGATRLLHVMRPWFILPLVGGAIIYATHLILNAFQGLLFQRQGIPPEMIGLLIAVGAISETAMFFAFKRLARRFSALHLLLFSALASVFRWVAMSFSPGVEILFALQLLHSVTFALCFIACVNFIADATSEDIAAEAQSFFVILQQATGVIAFVGFGWLAGRWGAHAYLASAAFAALGALLIGMAIRLRPAPA